MTCIAAIVKDGRTTLAADSCVSWWRKAETAEAKVFVKDGVGFAICGRVRESQLLRYSVTIPRRHSDDDAMKWMVCELVPAIAKCLEDADSQEKSKERASIDSHFIVAVGGRLFTIASDYAVVEVKGTPYVADGSGGAYALGSLFSTQAEKDVRKRLTTAIRAASEFDQHVGGEVVFVEVDHPETGK